MTIVKKGRSVQRADWRESAAVQNALIATDVLWLDCIMSEYSDTISKDVQVCDYCADYTDKVWTQLSNLWYTIVYSNCFNCCELLNSSGHYKFRSPLL